MNCSPASAAWPPRGALQGMWPSELAPNGAWVFLPALLRLRMWVSAAQAVRLEGLALLCLHPRGRWGAWCPCPACVGPFSLTLADEEDQQGCEDKPRWQQILWRPQGPLSSAWQWEHPPSLQDKGRLTTLGALPPRRRAVHTRLCFLLYPHL